MSFFNPVAIAWMIFGASLGYAIAGSFGLSVGLAVTSGLVAFASTFIK